MSMKTRVGAMGLAVLGLGVTLLSASTPPEGIREVRYSVTFDRTTAANRLIHVDMTFVVDDGHVVSLSLPSWTPGSYELDDYARNVRSVTATQNGGEIRWDKSDFDTWRVYPTGAGTVGFSFDYRADSLDTGSAWSKPDFAFFNGTNLFLFPENQDLSFPSRVTIHTEADWGIATSLTASDMAGDYTADDYHDLVDHPTFVGEFDIDSLRVDDAWYRLATYPAGVLAGEQRATMWQQIEQMMPVMADVMDEVPWDTYTILQVFDADFGGGSALEHGNSHLGIYGQQFVGSWVLPYVVAHETFHAWNVKRLRPADLWPYDYGRQMPTELLWVSEGITDYYADLALVRSGINTREGFLETTKNKIDGVNHTPPVALEDASLTTWVQPTDGTSSIYYPKGSLAGLMLDVLIRDASDNQHSLDDVMKTLYEQAYKNGRGFTEDMWWQTVREAARGRSFEEFHDRYIDGRDPYPWDEILPLAGLVLQQETRRVPRLGIGAGSPGHVGDVAPGSSAAIAGVRPGDELVSVGGIDASLPGFPLHFQGKFANEADGTPFDIVVRREGEELTLRATLQFTETTNSRIIEDPDASDTARRIREGILTGTTG